jgi:hypothetical protein
MTTLMGRMSRPLAAALADLLVRCLTHGAVPWVPICTCVLEGAQAAEATPSSVLCEHHIRMAEEGDPGADEDVQQVCLQCLTDRGIL